MLSFLKFRAATIRKGGISVTEKKNGWKDCWKYTVRCLRDVERCVPGRLTALLPVSLVQTKVTA